MFEKLEEALNLVPAPKPETKNHLSLENNNNTPDYLRDKEDQELARQTFRKMILKSEELLDDLIQIAKGTEHPRAFEVAANLVKTISEVAEKLDEVSSRNLKEKDSENNTTNINNNYLYVGSSEELIKIIRNNKGQLIE